MGESISDSQKTDSNLSSIQTLNDIEIPELDPFKNDLLDRKTFAKSLNDVIQVLDKKEGLVLILEANWGDGKTTFLKMWRKQLEKAGIPSIYIDAFSNDFMDNPFVLLAGELIKENNELIEEKKEIEIKANELLPLIKSAGKNLFLTFLKTIVKNKTGINFEEIISSLEKTVEEHNLFKDDITKYQEAKNKIAEFRTALENLSPNDTHTPLIVIVDELDRCKPSFAVELIETIKHFFSVKNIVFLLSVNSTHLESSIKHVYGSDIDAVTYWQKFIQFRLKLPNTRDNQGVRIIQEYVKKQFQRMKMNKNINEEKMNDYIIRITVIFSVHFSMSLREINQTILNMRVILGKEEIKNYLKSEESNTTYIRRVYLVIFCFLAVIKIKFPEILVKFADRAIYYENINIELKIEEISQNICEMVKLSKMLIVNSINFVTLSEDNYKMFLQEDRVHTKYFDNEYQYIKYSDIISYNEYLQDTEKVKDIAKAFLNLYQVELL